MPRVISTSSGRSISSHTGSHPGGNTIASSRPGGLARSRSGSSAHSRATTNRQNSEGKKDKLQKLADTAYKHLVLCDDMIGPLRRDTSKAGQVRVMYNRAIAEDSKTSRKHVASFDELEHELATFERNCEFTPLLVDDRLTIYINGQRVLSTVFSILAHPDSTNSDDDNFKTMGLVDIMWKNRMKEQGLQGPSHSVLHQTTPHNTNVHRVTDDDFAQWRANPTSLIQKTFVSTEDGLRKSFTISDYTTSHVHGTRYEVNFGDSGPDMFYFSVEDMLAMVAEAEFLG